MAKGYLIARAIVTNPSAWATYADKATETAKHYRGRYLARGGRSEVVEGEGRARNIVIEFDSFEDARAYAHSEQYAEARKLRENAGIIDIVVVEGADPA